MEKQIKVSIGIQARSTSERFPNKISQLIGQRTVLEHVIDACISCAHYVNRYTFTNKTVADVYILIPKNDPIKETLYHTQSPVSIIEGDEKDVLSRYAQLARESNADYVVRITADCPLVPPFLIFKCLNTAIKNGFDYFSNVGDSGPETMRTSIDGHDVEVLSRGALEWADKNAQSPKDREHVTTILRGDIVPHFIRRGVLIGHNDFSNIKLSLDTEADLEKIRDEFEKLQSKIAIAKRKYGKNAVHRF